MKNYELKQKEEQDLKNNQARLNKKKHNLLIAKREFEALSKRWDTEKSYYVETIAGMEKAVEHWESTVNKSGKVQCRICGKLYAGSYIERHMKVHDEEKVQARKDEEEASKKELKRLAKKAEESAKAEELRIAKLEEDRRLAEEAAIALATKLKIEDERKEIERIENEKLENEKRAKEEADRRVEAERARAENERERIEVEKQALLTESPHTELAQMKEISDQIGVVKEAINGDISNIEQLQDNHQEWINEYANENEGKKAIWQGRITDGFRGWLELKGYMIGE